MGYHIPTSLTDALEIAARCPATILAGGTDVFPSRGDRPPPKEILDITRLPDLCGIARLETGWRIGAATKWSEIVQADLPPAFDGLKLAAREVGGWQIQNAGTIAGNLCNASPAADGVPPLLTLSAEVELASLAGTRRVPVQDFITGVRQTVLKPDEIVTALSIPALPDDARGHFLKLGARKYLVISIAMAGALIRTDAAGKITMARVAVGACSAVAQALPDLEAALLGRAAPELEEDPSLWSSHLGPLSPIDDIRGSAGYRREAAAELLRRTVLACVGTGHG